MKNEQVGEKKNKGISLLFSIIVIFCVLGIVIFSVSHKISRQMSASAIQNLSESLDLIQCTIEAILNKEAEYQKIMALEIAETEDPMEHILIYPENQTMAKISLIPAGEKEGLSSNGEVFSEESLDFSLGGTVDGLPISQSYINDMGAWAYSMKCPVIKNDQEIATLYIEYIYDSYDRLLPEGFYNKKAMLYIMDTSTERFVLKPKGMGERNAGHLNLEDLYQANNIQEPELREQVEECLKNQENIMFYHDIRGKNSLNYMWTVNGGSIYLVGYVPIEAIQQEGKTVNHNIFVVVAVTLIAFSLCCTLYYFNQRQQNKVRREREEEREIHNQRLAEALQAAQLASNSKTMFLSNMSHDIRTPMNAVLGFTMLLAKDADKPDKVREYAKKITASGQHLLGLINDILDVSKIESGKVVLNVEKFTLNDLVSSVDAIIRPMTKEKKQKFHVEVMGIKHEYLLGDETRVNQILINLLSNAVKYTQEGGNIWFRIIGLRQRSAQYEHIKIEVEDDGYGMTPEYLEVIFDAFTRAENSTTNKVQGTGLGMAITKNIVELMGGTIHVTSEVNKGSLFRVDLEFRIPEDQSDRRFWKENGISRILVIENNSVDREDIRALMEDTGVEIDAVSNIEEAVQMLQEGKGEIYHSILLDWDMWETDGFREVARIREIIPDGIPVLIMTASDTEEMEAVLKNGKTGILPKPFFATALKEKIAEMNAEQKNDEASEMTEGGMLKGLHFLAAEDNEINAEILSEILSMEGAGCEIVGNGQLALERFANSEKGEFDAILMDVQMPVMNGYEATKAIRNLKREDAGKILIIAMTANAFAEDEKDALNAGMNVHLAKPIDIALLRKVIKEYIK